MVMRRPFPIAVAALLLGALGCPETNVDEPSPQVEQPPIRPRVLLELEVGVISATGSRSHDVLTFRSNLDGSVRIVLGRDCEGSEIFGEENVESGIQRQYTVRAEGALAEEGEYSIHACFTDEIGRKARSTVRLRVDNTPPTVVPTLVSGSYCGRRFVGFYCTDCVAVAYDFEPDLTFDEEGGVTSGRSYLGLEIPISGEVTIYFRGIDRAGNASPVESASYVTLVGEIAVTEIEFPAVSGNYASTQQSTLVELEGEPLSTFQVRRGSSCQLGTLVATGSLDETGRGSADVAAHSLHIGENELHVCAITGAGCAVETDFTLFRKDAALGWTPEPPAGTSAWQPCDAEVFFRFRDDSVSFEPEEMGFTIRVANTLANPPYSAEVLEDGLRVALEAACLPEGTRIDFDLAAGGFRDEAGNPLPAGTTWVLTAVSNEWLPFGPKMLTVDGDVVEDPATGLVWQRCVIGQGEGCSGTGTTHTWQNAHAACYALGTQEFAGRKDWRLPSARELSNLLDPAAVGTPLLLPPELVSGSTTSSWTATRPSQWADPFQLEFATGEMRQEWSNYARGLRCVAGRPEGLERSFARVRHQDGQFVEDAVGAVVHDSASGLYWELQPLLTTFTDIEAADACAGTLHGTEGWRLPTAAHLVTLFHFDGTPRLGRPPFAPELYGSYWLSPVASAYSMQPNSGAVTYVGFSQTRPVWCVHEGP